MVRKLVRYYTRSIQNMLKLSFVGILLLLGVPILINLLYVVKISGQYNQIVGNITFSMRLSETVQYDVPAEVWNIVVGQKKFTEGRQYEIVDQISRDLHALQQKTEEPQSATFIEAADQACRTLCTYIDQLGRQIEADAAVSSNEKTMQNIDEVSQLINQMLLQYIQAESNSAAQMHRIINQTTRYMMVCMAGLLACCAVIAAVTYTNLKHKIRQPIGNLEQLASQIAAGNLAARTEETGIEELVPLARSLNAMAERIDMLLRENVEKQKNVLKSEMRALQAQITPHFLYNTFDTIMWLAEDGKNEDVVEVTGAFSEFCRISLSRGRDWITVADEVRHIQNYFVVQSYRYSDILQYEVTADPAVLSNRCLKLLLQPLVENALYHGIKNTRAGGTIRVQIQPEDNGRIRFTVSDDGAGMTAQQLDALRRTIAAEDNADSVLGYGLFNVSKRLRLYYGTSDLTAASAPGEGTTITFTLPKEEGAHDV